MGIYTLHTDREKHFLQSEYEATPTLIEEPIGWKKSNKKISRSKKTHEFIEKNAKDLEFIGKGRAYILETDSKYGSNTKIKYIIQKENPLKAGDFFEDEYYIDIESLKDKNSKLSCKVDEGGLSKTLKAKQNEKVELDRGTSLDGKEITTLETDKLLLKGRKIFLQSVLKAVNKPFSLKSKGKNNLVYKISPFPLELQHQNKVLDFIGSTFQTVVGEEQSSTLSVNDFLIIHIDRDRVIDLNIDISFFVKELKIEESISNQIIKLYLVVTEKKESDNFHTKKFEDLGNLKINKNNNFSINRKLDLKKDDSVALYIYTRAYLGSLTDYGHWSFEFKNLQGRVTISEDSQIEATKTKCLTAFNQIERHLEIITGNKRLLTSNLLTNGIASTTLLFPLLWVRLFTEKDKKKPSISLKDVIDSVCIAWGGSAMIEKQGYKEVLRIEDFDFFYNNNILIKFPKPIEDIETTYAKEFLYTSYEVGSEKGGDDYEESTGLGEYNGVSEFTTIRTGNEKKLSLKTKIRRDPSGIEFARRKNVKIAPQEDTKYDSDFAMLDAKKGVTDTWEERLWNDDFGGKPIGIYSPETATNLRLTAKQILKRRSIFITCNLYHYQDTNLKFINSNCNTDLVLKKDGKTEKESDDIKLSDLGKPRFKPYWKKVKTTIDFETQKKLRSKTTINGREVYNFYGISEFTTNTGDKIYGYLFDVNESNGEVLILEANL